MANYTTIKEIDNDGRFMLVTDSQDLISILDYVGKPEMIEKIGCMFVEILEGDYGEIYYSKYCVPYLVDKVKKLNEKF